MLRITVCDDALTRIGEVALQSESAAGAEPVLRLYDSVLHFLLGLHPWHFAAATRQLPRLAEAPEGGFWKYAYRLPADRAGPPEAVFEDIESSYYLDYQLAGDLLLTDAEKIFVTFQRKAEPPTWTPLFRECVVLLLASELALSRREDRELRRELRQDVLGDPRAPGEMGLLGQAKAADDRAKPSEVLMGSGGPLLEARRS